jgi:toxin-antitoxin system PIN domain toxin
VTFLLDVNVLVAIAWPTHDAHERVRRWLTRHAKDEWATCPFTETGFVRIVSNPAFSPHALTPRQAAALLNSNLKHPGHRFWSSDIGFSQAAAAFQERVRGHQQITDAYLLGLTLHKRGRLVTLDTGIAELLPEGSPHRASVEVIGA